MRGKGLGEEGECFDGPNYTVAGRHKFFGHHVLTLEEGSELPLPLFGYTEPGGARMSWSLRVPPTPFGNSVQSSLCREEKGNLGEARRDP